MAPSKSGLAVLLAVVAALIVAATAARAEEGPMPEEIAWKLLEIGRVIDPPKTAAIYAPLQEKEPYPGVKIERDVKYGAADRNRLDIFMPETASSPRPVLIFVHGGAFVTGDKRVGDGPFSTSITGLHRKRRGRRARKIWRLLLRGSRARSASAAAMPRASI